VARAGAEGGESEMETYLMVQELAEHGVAEVTALPAAAAAAAAAAA